MIHALITPETRGILGPDQVKLMDGRCFPCGKCSSAEVQIYHNLAKKHPCSICGADVVVFPSSVEQAKEDPSFHIVCMPQCSGKIAEGRQIQFGGRIVNDSREVFRG